MSDCSYRIFFHVSLQAPLYKYFKYSFRPIPREEITKIVVKIVEQCKRKPRVVSLLGDAIHEPISPKSKAALDKLVSEGKVYECRGAPYGKLFPHADCVIIHGGLGATSEAMRAGKPVICTGVLLMDQRWLDYDFSILSELTITRFWGNRCKAIGIASEMKHISAFASSCVAQVDDALAPDSPYAVAAHMFAPKIRTPLDPTGVTVNVEAVSRLLSDAVPIRSVRMSSKSVEAIAG